MIQRGPLYFVYSAGDGPAIFLGSHDTLEQAMKAEHTTGSEIRKLEEWRRQMKLEPTAWPVVIVEVRAGWFGRLKVRIQGHIHRPAPVQGNGSPTPAP